MSTLKETLTIMMPDVDVDRDEVISEIQGILTFHIRLAYGAVYRHFSDSFAHLNLTQKEVAVLWLVDDHLGIAQADVAQRMRMDRSTTMMIVNRLQARGYLVLGKSRTDLRKKTLNLTPIGRTALVVAKVAIRQHEGWLKSRFTDKEVVALINLLIRVHK